MNPGADVASIDVLSDWYAALVEFRTKAAAALASVSLSLQHATAWLAEQQHHWHRQIRLCEEDVVQAKAELRARQLSNLSGERPDCTVQEVNLRKAKARLQFAEEQMEAVRRWTKRLPTEILDTYDGPAHQLTAFLDGELPRGLTALTRQITALEHYVNLRSGPAPAPATTPDKEKS
jgi:hypothetical protein